MKKYLFILFYWPGLLFGQIDSSCPLDHYSNEVYENPLLEKYLSKYDVKFYYISLEVSNENTYISGSANILVRSLDNLDTIVFQLIDPLLVTAVEINDVVQLNFLHQDDALFIPVIAAKGNDLSVKIYYKGDAGQDRGFFAGVSSVYDESNKQKVTYTLSEPLNARDWFPVKQVLTDKADSVWLDLICKRDLMVGSNGLLTEIEDLPDDKHMFKWRSTYPIDYYLISFAVADYRDYSFYAMLSGDNDSVLVQNFIYNDDDYFSQNESKINRTGEIITLYSNLVGDYPFAREKYGHCVAPLGGGMEHQTMTTLANFSFNLVSHELAHMWFGDNITCGNWQDIWLNEGFASYFNYIALDMLYGKENAKDWMTNAMQLAKNSSGSVYVPADEVENEYRVFDTGLTYKKGAVILHMIRYVLDDDDLFFKVLQSYSIEYKDSTATANDFIKVLENVSGMDFSCFFDQWYYGKGFPSFYIAYYTKDDTLYIESHEETSSSETPLFETPFDLEIQTDEGNSKVRFYQEQEDQLFMLPLSSYVNSIVFDPDNRLLAKGIVVSKRTLENKLIIGPNPTHDVLMLKFLQQSDFSVLKLFNLNGNLVMSEEIDMNPYRLDLTSLPFGAYILLVKGKEGTVMEKILKLNVPL